jgi:protein-disulfide isomerase
LSTKPAPPAPSSRHQRRLAARSAGAASSSSAVAAVDRRRSPLLWTTVAVVVFGIVLVVVLFITQGAAPRTVDVGSLQPPMVPTPLDQADGRTLGGPDAPVTLEVWSDFQCPACGQFAELVEPALIRNYVTPGTLRIIHHDSAFQGRRAGAPYDESVEAGAAARCAAEQDAYWTFHDWVFANQVGENGGAFRDERLRGIATAAGLDVVAWDACRATGEQQAAVRAETQQAIDQGIDATPTMILNGETIVGLRTAAELGQMIEAAAAAASS